MHSAYLIRYRFRSIWASITIYFLFSDLRLYNEKFIINNIEQSVWSWRDKHRLPSQQKKGTKSPSKQCHHHSTQVTCRYRSILKRGYFTIPTFIHILSVIGVYITDKAKINKLHPNIDQLVLPQVKIRTHNIQITWSIIMGCLWVVLTVKSPAYVSAFTDKTMKNCAWSLIDRIKFRLREGTVCQRLLKWRKPILIV